MAVICLIAGSSAQARSGDVDPSFSGDGQLHLEDFAGHIVPEDDGGLFLLVEGRVQKLTPAGELETAFGDEGWIRHPFSTKPDNNDYAVAAAAGADGKLVIGGVIDDGYFDADTGLARYRRDGTLDPSFGSGGVVRIVAAPDSTYEVVSDLFPADGGQIYAVIASKTGAVVARFDRSGGLDASFGQDGFVRSPPDRRSDFTTSGVIAPGPANSVYAGRASFDPAHPDWPLVRLLPDGSIDPTFDGAPFANLGIKPVKLMPSVGDTLVVFGRDDASGRIVRLNADGSLDASFDWRAIEAALPPIRPVDAAVAPDGSIVTVGTSKALIPGTGRTLDVARLTASGSLDRGFSGDGRAPVSLLGASWLSAGSVALAPDGKVLVAGTSTTVPRLGDTIVEMHAIARLRVDDGPPDADSDRVGDAADRCVLQAGKPRDDGCAVLKRWVTIQRHRNGFSGHTRCAPRPEPVLAITGRSCVGASEIEIFKRAPGRDRKIGHVRGKFGWRLSGVSPRPGTYYARLRPGLIHHAAIAAEARSEPVRIR